MSKIVEKRVRHSSAQWQGMFARFEAEGLSVVEFCRRNRVSPSSFHRWRQLLSGAMPTVAPAAVSSFLELPSVAAPVSERWQIELELGDGVVLRFAR